MHLVYLYGPPGVGKLTIGTQLADQTGFKLFHNHLVVDLACSLFQRETPEYFNYIRVVRGAGFEAAARAGVSLVATGVHRDTPEYLAAMERMMGPVRALGGKPLFVQLTCEREEWLARLQSASRRTMNKLTDPAFTLDFAERFKMWTPMPFEPHLSVNTTGRTPDDVAREIALSLPDA